MAVDRTSISVSGIGGASNNTLGRFVMVLTFRINGEEVQLKGECHIYPAEQMAGCEILLGMPFLKKNAMSMRFGEGEDRVSVGGQMVPIRMNVEQARVVEGVRSERALYRLTGVNGKGVLDG